MLNDPQKMLKLLSRSSAIREAILGREANWREEVETLRSVRDRWAHGETISTEQAVAALNSAERLLRGAGRHKHADEIVALRNRLMRHAERRGQRQAATTAVDPFHGKSMVELFYAAADDLEREDRAQAQSAAADPSHGKSMVELFIAGAADLEREDLAQAQTAAVDPSHGKSMVELFYAAADDLEREDLAREQSAAVQAAEDLLRRAR